MTPKPTSNPKSVIGALLRHFAGGGPFDASGAELLHVRVEDGLEVVAEGVVDAAALAI